MASSGAGKVRAPGTTGTLGGATTIQACTELASASEILKIQGAVNRYAPRNTIVHKRHAGINTPVPKHSGAGILTLRRDEGLS